MSLELDLIATSTLFRTLRFSYFTYFHTPHVAVTDKWKDHTRPTLLNVTNSTHQSLYPNYLGLLT